MNREQLKRSIGWCLISGWLLAIGTAECQGQVMAERVVQGGIVWTGDAARPQAEAVAWRGDRILAVGSRREIARWIGPETEVIQIPADQMVLPGLIEGHGHYLGLGQSLMMLRLADARTWDEVVERVSEAARVMPPGTWIVGRGWHQSKWDTPPQPNVDGYPTSDQLDQLTPNHPVLLTHASGHMSFANSYAMRLAGVDAQTKPPAGGEILVNEAGKPIGIFRETAQNLISAARARDESRMTPDQRAESTLEAIALAGQACLKHGITSFQDAGTSGADLRVMRELAVAGKLPVRLWMMIRDEPQVLTRDVPLLKSIGLGDDFLTIRAIKLSLDGALGPHGAWLLEPYLDLPSSAGLNITPIESIEQAAELALQNDFQLCVHAIGDRANRVTLDIFERALKSRPAAVSRRWRVEHAQHLHPDDLPRFAQLGVIASMQGIHCTSDAIFVLQRLGGLRAEQGAYMWRSLVDSGAVVTNGTDAPVEDINPFPSLEATITRRIADGSQFFPAQALTREEALRSYTIDCAYAAFEETIKGSLVPGKLADLVVVDRNLLTCPADDIGETQVCLTVLGGRVVYRREAETPSGPANR